MFEFETEPDCDRFLTNLRPIF